MRVLRFFVDGKTIVPDLTSDFDGLFPGRNNDILAEFEFSPEWYEYDIVATFWSMMGIEYPPQELDVYYTCSIPMAALQRPAFKIQMRATDENGDVVMTTDRLTIYQRGSQGPR